MLEPSATLLSPAAAQHVNRTWHNIYASLRSVESQGRHLGPERTVRVSLAVFFATILLSLGMCCVHSRAGSWLIFAMASIVVPPPRLQGKGRPARAEAAAAFPGPREGLAAEGAVSALPSTSFSASARSLRALAAGEVTEFDLGAKTGNMVLCVTLQPASSSGKVVTVEVVHEPKQRMLMASCSSQEGPGLAVRDAAGTFRGALEPQEPPPAAGGAGPAGGARRHGLFAEGAPPRSAVLAVEGPADGQLSPGRGSLVARTASGGTLATLSLDEDDMEVTLMHSAMDSVVIVSLMGFYLLKNWGGLEALQPQSSMRKG